MSENISEDEQIEKDIQEYLENSSDFDLELRCLNTFKDSGYKCSHAGSYEDPVTNKTREYDLRCSRVLDYKHDIFFMAECKAIKDPLIISLVKSNKEERTFNYLFRTNPRPTPKPYNNFYDEYIGKSSTQINVKIQSQQRRGQEPTINRSVTYNDTEIFEKWTQALSSAHSIISTQMTIAGNSCCCFLPIVIIPDNKLWGVIYNEEKGSKEIKKLDKCDYYVRKIYPTHKKNPFIINCIQFVTESNLSTFISKMERKFHKLYSTLHNF